MTAIEEMTSVRSALFDFAEACCILPYALKQALSKLQKSQEKILLEEQSKLRVCEVKDVAALKETGSRLTGHEQKIDDISLIIKALAYKFSKFEEKQDDVVKLLHSIYHTVSDIDNARKGEESRETARRWRLQQEKEINAALDDSVAAAINHLAEPIHHEYRISGSRPEFHDQNIPWKNSVHCPAEIKLPTDRQLTVEEIKHWTKNELMRYFVTLIKESTVFDRCKIVSDAAKEFSSHLEIGVLPSQLAMLSKHRKGSRVTHLEDCILAYEKLYEERAIYQNRGKDALMNWRKDTEFDPNKRKPWRHAQHYRN
ncbi:hypothetical protein OROMI_023980 [Orobanche minor]